MKASFLSDQGRRSIRDRGKHMKNQCVYACVCVKGPGQSHRVKEKKFLPFFDYFKIIFVRCLIKFRNLFFKNEYV